jgi:hypothetical protein
MNIDCKTRLVSSYGPLSGGGKIAPQSPLRPSSPGWLRSNSRARTNIVSNYVITEMAVAYIALYTKAKDDRAERARGVSGFHPREKVQTMAIVGVAIVERESLGMAMASRNRS